MGEKPTAAFILSLIGGIFVVIGGIWLAIVGAVIAIFTAGLGIILSIFTLFGFIIIVGAIMMNSNPSSTKTWGAIVLILGIISLFGVITAFGGLLSLIGGILALVWKPEISGQAASPPPPP